MVSHCTPAACVSVCESVYLQQVQLPQSCVLSVTVFRLVQLRQVEAAALNLSIQQEVTLWEGLRQGREHHGNGHTHTHTHCQSLSLPHMEDVSGGAEEPHAGVGQRVHTQHAQSLDERHHPLQGHLLLAAGQHCIQALQHNDDIIIGRPWQQRRGGVDQVEDVCGSLCLSFRL